MNKKQLDKINDLLDNINKMKEIFEIKGEIFRITDFNEHQALQYTNNDKDIHWVKIEGNIIKQAIKKHIEQLKAELKELGYEE